MKEILRSPVHQYNKSHVCIVCEHAKKKIKFTYEAYNAVERFTVEIFDGYMFNSVFTLKDLGFIPCNTAYIDSDEERKERSELIYKCAVNACIDLLK